MLYLVSLIIIWRVSNILIFGNAVSPKSIHIILRFSNVVSGKSYFYLASLWYYFEMLQFCIWQVFIILRFSNVVSGKSLLFWNLAMLYLASLKRRSARCPCRTKLFLKLNFKTYFCIFYKLCAIRFIINTNSS